MATYIAQCRSNYFKVKDEAQYRIFCQQYDLELITESPAGEGAYRFGFLLYESIPSGRTDDKGERIETDFIQELAKQLAQGEVAVVMEVGSEKMRYLNGYAVAVNSKGKTIELGLGEIYERAKKKWGIMPSKAEY